MSMEKKIHRIGEKLNKIKSNLNEIYKWFDLDVLKKELAEENLQRLYAIYYATQTTIEAIMDTSGMLAKIYESIVDDDYNNIDFIKSKNIISMELAEKIKKMNGLRNRLVHEYNGIKNEMALDAIAEFLPFFHRFVSEVQQWIQNRKP